MTPETYRVVERGLDQGLCAHVAKLFGVLMTNPQPEAAQRFLNGLDGAVKVYEAALDEVRPQEVIDARSRRTDRVEAVQAANQAEAGGDVEERGVPVAGRDELLRSQELRNALRAGVVSAPP
jgi:hypothetical protein